MGRAVPAAARGLPPALLRRGGLCARDRAGGADLASGGGLHRAVVAGAAACPPGRSPGAAAPPGAERGRGATVQWTSSPSVIIWIDVSRADVPRQESADPSRNVQGAMPEQPPQSPLPDEPASSSPTPGPRAGTRSGSSAADRWPSDTARGTPGPPAYAPQGPLPGAPAHANGRVAARVATPPAGPGATRGAGYPPGPAPGYGPPGYAPGSGPAAWSGQPGSAPPTQAFDLRDRRDGRDLRGRHGAGAKKKDLTVNKLVAGAGAAATSAVLGSFFGAMGTVGGAALGSVFSAIVTAGSTSTRSTRPATPSRPASSCPAAAPSRSRARPRCPRRGGTDQASTRVFVTPGDQPTEVLSAVPAVVAEPAVDAGPPKSRRRCW